MLGVNLDIADPVVRSQRLSIQECNSLFKYSNFSDSGAVRVRRRSLTARSMAVMEVRLKGRKPEQAGLSEGYEPVEYGIVEGFYLYISSFNSSSYVFSILLKRSCSTLYLKIAAMPQSCSNIEARSAEANPTFFSIFPKDLSWSDTCHAHTLRSLFHTFVPLYSPSISAAFIHPP